MRHLQLIISTVILSFMSVMASASSAPKAAQTLQRLNNAWNRQGVEANPLLLEQDTHVVYGGRDIARRPSDIATNLA